jgi:hypothetical protein
VKTLRPRPAPTSDHLFQAEAFIALLARLPSADLNEVFVWWANSKDFSPRDQLAIAREVHRILGNDDLGEPSESSTGGWPGRNSVRNR